MANPPHVVVLAAEAGKGMDPGLPKALNPVLFRPLIHYVLDMFSSIPHQSICVVVPHGQSAIQEQCRDYKDALFFELEAENPACRSLAAVEPFLRNQGGDVLILNGDAVLLKAESLKQLLEMHVESRAAATHGDGVYCFTIKALFEALKKAADRAGDRECLSAAVKSIDAEGKVVARLNFSDPVESMGINDLHELWQVETILRQRINRDLMLKGVVLQDPHTTLIDPRCQIEPGVRVEGGTTLINSILRGGCRVENFCRIVDSEVGEGCRIKQGSYIEKGVIGRGSGIGPYAHLRPGVRLGEEVHIGNFVEVKNSSLGSGSKAGHLSYIGDTQAGKNVNFGCGFITCNYDGGPVKQKTTIEDDVFIGSDSQTIAPVTLGAGSFIATGTSVTDDVPPESFAISRSRQITKVGYAKKYRKSRKPAAVS